MWSKSGYLPYLFTTAMSRGSREGRKREQGKKEAIFFIDFIDGQKYSDPMNLFP